jgi:hypothetical protein
MSVPRILGDRPITPPNMLPYVENYGRHPIHAWMWRLSDDHWVDKAFMSNDFFIQIRMRSQ